MSNRAASDLVDNSSNDFNCQGSGQAASKQVLHGGRERAIIEALCQFNPMHSLGNPYVGLIYDSYDTTRRIENTVNSIFRITVALLVIVVLLVVGIIVFVCILGCRKYQNESGSATQHAPLKTYREQRRPEHQPPVTEKLMRHHTRSEPQPPPPQPPSSSSQAEPQSASPIHQPRKSAPIEI
ncbi:hypothetical protein OSTOST_19993 [Ostertagia ostertagi]